MANIILKDKNGTDITHMGIDYLCMRTLEGGLVRFNEGDIRVISVDELPSENIKEDAIYKVSATDEDGNAKVVFYTYVDGEWTEYKVGKDPVFENLEITENGTYTPAEGVDGWSEVTVNVESNPVLTELVVTENGVYDKPVNVKYPVIRDPENPENIVLKAGDTLTFKRHITLPPSIQEELNNSGVCESIIAQGDVFNVGVFGSAELDWWYLNYESPEGIISYYSQAYCNDMGYSEAGWYNEDGEKVDPPTIIVGDINYFVSSLCPMDEKHFFVGTSTPVDGWNKVTVNVAGDIIDVDELPTENVDDSKIYRMNEEKEPIVWVAFEMGNEQLSVSFAELAVMMGVPNPTIYAYVVESLPDEMEPMDNSNGVFPCYVLESTGVAYVSQDGTSTTATSLSSMLDGADGGWVNSVDEIVLTGIPTFYTVRGGSLIKYGTPNNNGDKVLYEYTSENGWVDVKKSFEDEIGSLQDEAVSLQGEIDSLTEQNANITTEKEQLENQNAELTERVENFFNIAYGDAEPTDTSKLWLKTSEPTDVLVSPIKNEKDENVSILNATMVNPSNDCCGAVVGEKFYYFGGTYGYTNDCGQVYCFDAATSSLTLLANTSGESIISTERYCCASVGKKIYIFARSSCCCFDTETESFSKISANGTFNNLRNKECVAVGSKIYFFGGYNTSSGVWTSRAQCFDTETNTVEDIADIPATTTTRLRVAVVGTDIYMYLYKNKAMCCFDTVTNTYTDYPIEQSMSFPWGVIDSTIYGFNGSSIYAFDTITKTVSTLNNSLKYYVSSGKVVASINNRIYLFGATIQLTGTEITAIQCFNPFEKTLEIEENKLQIIPSLEENIFRLTNEESKSVEIGVDRVYKGNSYGEGELVSAALYKDGAWTNLY